MVIFLVEIEGLNNCHTYEDIENNKKKMKISIFPINLSQNQNDIEKNNYKT